MTRTVVLFQDGLLFLEQVYCFTSVLHSEVSSTCLNIAALTGNTAVARVLIRHGADVSQSDKDGKTVLMVRQLKFISCHYYYECCALMLSLSIMVLLYIFILQLAALNGYSELAQLLISNGADPTAHTEVSDTSL